MKVTSQRILEIAGIPTTKENLKKLNEAMGPDNSKKFFISIGDFNTPEEDAETIQILTSAGFKSGTDFKLNIAMGDDIAHGITIYNPAMFDEPAVKAQLQAIDNPDDTYGGKTDRAAYNRLYKRR